MIDLNDMTALNKLQKAVRYQYAMTHCVRDKRSQLQDLYRGYSTTIYGGAGPSRYDGGSSTGGYFGSANGYVNLIQSFVYGQIVSLAWRGPQFSVKARSPQGFGLDKRMSNFLGEYTVLMQLPRIFRQIIIDSCFGWGCVKVTNGVLPRGVKGTHGPKAFRVSPNNFIVDGSMGSIDEAGYCADIYLAALNETRALFPTRAEELTEWSGGSSTDYGSTSTFQNSDAYPEAYTRLIDLYVPSREGGFLGTWPCRSDAFGEIATPPLMVIPVTFNPYEVLSLLPSVPDTNEELARLDALKNLHLLTNDMWAKAARQTRKSKRNPMAQMGAEHDLQNLDSKADTESVLVEDLTKIGLYTLPGADPIVIQMAQMAMQMFSSQGGNIDVALGQATGASTARQTQSLIQQISARQSIDREQYERFASGVAQKIMTLAFSNPTLSLPVQQNIPGTNVSFENGWQTPDQMPRTAEINDFTFETVPYSTALRTPEDRVKQLTQLSAELLQWFQMSAQTGGLINLEQVLAMYSESYQLPELPLLWSGQPPDPIEKSSGGQYVAQAGPNGSTVEHTYEGTGGGGGGAESQFVGGEIQPAGLSIPQVGGV